MFTIGKTGSFRGAKRKRLAILSMAIALTMIALIPAVSSASGAAPIIWPTTPEAANKAGKWPALTDIQCGAYIVMDRASGRVLLEKQPDLPLFPASTTKILTAILGLEKLDPNATVTVSALAVKLPAGSSKVGYKAGEQVVVRDLLAGMMLASGNDAANAVAEAVSGSQEAFAALMNERARKAGAMHSNFVNPSGTHVDQHVTTARDLAAIAHEAMKNPRFGELVSMESCSLPATNMHPYNGWAVLINTNRLMVFDDTYYRSDWLKEITGIKTGSTNMAGDCLVASAVTPGGAELIGVILKVPLTLTDNNKATYMRTLLEEGSRLMQGSVTPAPTSAATSGGTTAGTTPGGTTKVTSTTPSGTSASTAAGSTGTAAMTSTTGTPQTGPSTTTTGDVPVKTNGGFLEDLRLRLGIDPSSFLMTGLVVGILIGVLGGLILVLTLSRAAYKPGRTRSVSGRREDRH